MKRLLRSALFLLATAIIAPAAIIIDFTDPDVDLSGTDEIWYAGYNQPGAIVQSFTAPTGAAALTRVRFFLLASFDENINFTTTPTPLNVSIYTWNMATYTPGSHLWTTPNPITSPAGGLFDYVDVPTGSVAVTPGNTYAVMFTSPQGTGDPAYTLLGYRWNSDAYADGYSYFYNPSDVSDGPYNDLSMALEFSEVPEPGTVVLGLTALAAMAVYRRKRTA